MNVQAGILPTAVPQTTPSDFGIIFDWDGVIVDSAAQHEESWEMLSVEERRTLPDGHFKATFGKKNEWIIPHFFGWTNDPAQIIRLSLRKEALYREIVSARGLLALPGVHEFLLHFKASHIRCWIGSSSHRENISVALAALGFQSLFGGMVASEDVQQGKPHPEVFLKAAAFLNLPPTRCIVFEDSFAGIAAARAGGMKVVGVATTHASSLLAADTHRIVHRLDELTVADLRALVSAA